MPYTCPTWGPLESIPGGKGRGKRCLGSRCQWTWAFGWRDPGVMGRGGLGKEESGRHGSKRKSCREALKNDGRPDRASGDVRKPSGFPNNTLAFQVTGGAAGVRSLLLGPSSSSLRGTTPSPLQPRRVAQFGYWCQDSPQCCLSWCELFFTSTHGDKADQEWSLEGRSQRWRAEQGQAEKRKPRDRPPELPCTVSGAPSLRFGVLWPSVVGTCPRSLGCSAFFPREPTVPGA